MNCDECGKRLNKNKIYSNHGYTLMCCSVNCLACSFLKVRVMPLRETQLAMGFMTKEEFANSQQIVEDKK